MPAFTRAERTGLLLLAATIAAAAIAMALTHHTTVAIPATHPHTTDSLTTATATPADTTAASATGSTATTHRMPLNDRF